MEVISINSKNLDQACSSGTGDLWCIAVVEKTLKTDAPYARWAYGSNRYHLFLGLYDISGLVQNEKFVFDKDLFNKSCALDEFHIWCRNSSGVYPRSIAARLTLRATDLLSLFGLASLLRYILTSLKRKDLILLLRAEAGKQLRPHSNVDCSNKPLFVGNKAEVSKVWSDLLRIGEIFNSKQFPYEPLFRFREPINCRSGMEWVQNRLTTKHSITTVDIKNLTGTLGRPYQELK